MKTTNAIYQIVTLLKEVSPERIAEARAAGLVPQSGDWQKPGRFIQDPDKKDSASDDKGTKEWGSGALFGNAYEMANKQELIENKDALIERVIYAEKRLNDRAKIKSKALKDLSISKVSADESLGDSLEFKRNDIIATLMNNLDEGTYDSNDAFDLITDLILDLDESDRASGFSPTESWSPDIDATHWVYTFEAAVADNDIESLVKNPADKKEIQELLSERRLFGEI